MTPPESADLFTSPLGPIIYLIGFYVIAKFGKEAFDFWVKLKNNGQSEERRRAADDMIERFFKAAEANRELLTHLAAIAEGCVKLHERQYSMMEQQFAKDNWVHGEINGKIDVMNDRIGDLVK